MSQGLLFLRNGLELDSRAAGNPILNQWATCWQLTGPSQAPGFVNSGVTETECMCSFAQAFLPTLGVGSVGSETLSWWLSHLPLSSLGVATATASLLEKWAGEVTLSGCRWKRGARLRKGG